MTQKQKVSNRLNNAIKKWMLACIHERMAKMEVDAMSRTFDEITGVQERQIKLSVVKNENRS
jgi:hypothetical protein